jgi:hypothetical protein
MGISKKQQLFNLIEERTGCSDFDLNTSINFDLGMDGDDADEFLMEYSRMFEVDLSGFDFHLYFGNEGCNPFTALLHLLVKPKQQKLTIEALLKGIEDKRLES